jgi:hypothetical protein
MIYMPRRSISSLQAELETLQQEAARIRSAGLVLESCWIGTSSPRGTAGKPSQGKDYYELRSRKPIFDGKKSRYVREAEVGEFREAIDSGRQLKVIQSRIERLREILR